jgi:hypothetical protein
VSLSDPLVGLAIASGGALIGGIPVVLYARWLNHAGPDDIGFWHGAALGSVTFALASDWLVRHAGDHAARGSLEWIWTVASMTVVGGFLAGMAGAFIGLFRAVQRRR